MRKKVFNLNLKIHIHILKCLTAIDKIPKVKRNDLLVLKITHYFVKMSNNLFVSAAAP